MIDDFCKFGCRFAACVHVEVCQTPDVDAGKTGELTEVERNRLPKFIDRFVRITMFQFNFR